MSPQYIAGFMDGESYIGLHHHKANGTLAVRVNISQKRPHVLELIQKQYGGHMHSRTQRGHTWYELWLYGEDAHTLLRKVSRHLVVKHRECQLALRWVAERKRILKQYSKVPLDRVLHYANRIKEIRREENQPPIQTP